MRFFISIIMAAMILTSCQHKNLVKIQVNTNEVISENFIGNGVQWSAYPHADTENADWGLLMTDEKWDMNFERLDYMQPRLFRVLDQANWRYLVGFDENDMPVLDFTTPEVKALEKILDYAQANNITVLFGEWGTPYKVHDTHLGHGDKFSGANDAKWINSIVAYLEYLIIKKGYTCLKYYNLVNEPNGDWATTNGDFAEWSEGVKMLNDALKAKGLDQYISVAGPDAVTRYDNPNSQYTGAGWVEQTAKQLDDYVGIYEVHDYTEYDLVRSGGFRTWHERVAQYARATGKQIIFGELGFSRNGQANQEKAKADPYACEDSQMDVYNYSYGIDMADGLIQSMNAGYSGSAAWALDDAMHTCGDWGNKNELKRWGMWNSLGTELCNNPDDENIRPWFYSWSLLCRYFPTGSSVLKTSDTGIEGLRLTASAMDDDMTIALVNNSMVAHEIELDVSLTKPIKKFLYVDGERKVDENGFPVATEQGIKAKNGIQLSVPANSFVLLTSLEY
ncbi:MAG: glycoside hydrolase family 5 protein [Bacteroidales bacterium]|nr:glycoside hydrolase family 5 protein [Bacteroidales bacterium]